MLCLSGFELYSRWVPLIQCLLPAKRPEGHGFETLLGNNREVRPGGADDPAITR